MMILKNISVVMVSILIFIVSNCFITDLGLPDWNVESKDTTLIEYVELDSIVITNDAVGHAATAVSLDSADKKFSKQLKVLFLGRIDDTRIQIQLLDMLSNYLLEKYGENWRVYLNAMLNYEFSSRVDLLLVTLEKMDVYKILADTYMNDAGVAAASGSDVRALEDGVWDARYEVFGKESERIWQSAYNKRRLDSVFEKMNEHELTITEKVSMLTADIDSVYQKGEEGYLNEFATELSLRFVNTPSVKSMLSDKSGYERREILRNIRAGFGMDKDALERWDNLDVQREQRRQLGATYMEERAVILSTENAGDANIKVAGLQERLFGEMTKLIQYEESHGYFRFPDRR